MAPSSRISKRKLLIAKLVVTLVFLCSHVNLVSSSEIDDDDSLENALEAIERRQRDLQLRDNYGQPENIGYGFQKNLGFFAPGPARHLGAIREPDDLAFPGVDFGESVISKRTRSNFRERNGGPADNNNDNNVEYMQALRGLWQQYQRQRAQDRPIDLEDMTNEEVAELLNALEESDELPARGARNYRVFDDPYPPRASRQIVIAPDRPAKRNSQHLNREQTPNDGFLYSLKWVNPGLNREGVERLRSSDSWADDRDSDVASLLSQPRYQGGGESWLSEPITFDGLEYGNEQPIGHRTYAPRDRKRSPVKRNANHAPKQTTAEEVKGIFGTDKKKATAEPVKKPAADPAKKKPATEMKKQVEKRVVRREEPSRPGEITELFRVQKKSIDWTKHFGVNKRMYANPFDTRVFNTKRNLADNLNAVENRIGGVEDRILEDAVKLTGARGDEGLEAVREGILRRLEAAYSLEKMRSALEEFKDTVGSGNTESPLATTTLGEKPGLGTPNHSEVDKEKRVAVKKEGVGDSDNLEFLNWQLSSAGGSEAGDQCPLLEALVDNCVRMEEALGKFAELLTPACTLHQICYTCGPEFGFSHETTCDRMFMSEAEDLCQGKPECVGGARETVLGLREAYERSPPIGTCRANPCVADFFRTSPSGIVTLNMA